MKVFIFLSLLLLSFAYGHAQNDYNGTSYYQKIAGDSALRFGDLYREHAEHPMQISVFPGLYRIMTNPDLQMLNDWKIEVKDKQGIELATTKHLEYIEFLSPEIKDLEITLKTKHALPEQMKVIGRMFWVYSKTIDKDPPPFELTDLEGNVYTNENLRGKVAIINFWGTQCSPCIKEIPELNKLVQQYAGKDDVVFIAISSETDNKIKKFLQKRDFDYQQISINNPRDIDLEERFTNLGAAPCHFVLDKEGKLVFQYLGYSMRIQQMLSHVIDEHI